MTGSFENQAIASEASPNGKQEQVLAQSAGKLLEDCYSRQANNGICNSDNSQRAALADGGLRTINHNSDGSTTQTDDKGRIVKVERTDGTRDEFSYSGTRLSKWIAIAPTSNTTTWVPDSPKDWEKNRKGTIVRWESNERPDEVRIDLRVGKDGSVTYEDVPGSVITRSTDGTTSRLNVNGTEVHLDADHKITSMSNSKGAKLEAEYTNDALSKITESTGKSKSVWQVDAHGVWSTTGKLETRTKYVLSEDGIDSFISAEKGNVTHIAHPDGTERNFEYTNGQLTKILEQPSQLTWTRDGTSDKWSVTGPLIPAPMTEIRKNVRVGAEGQYSFVNDQGYTRTFDFDGTEQIYKHFLKAPNKGVQRSEQSLFNAIDRVINNVQVKEQFKQDVIQFERRAETDKIAASKVQQTMVELKRLLIGSDQSFFTQTNREKIAVEAAFHIAIPRTIDQGKYDTCGAATAEVFTSAKYPDRFVNLLRQVADRGTYMNIDGHVVRPVKDSLAPDTEATDFVTHDSSKNGERSFASQIFQTVAIDHVYKGKRFYLSDASGERVVDNQGKTLLPEFPGLEDPQVKEIVRGITGHHETIYSEGVQFKTLNEFTEALDNVRQRKEFPIILSVDTLSKGGPFYGQYRDDRLGLDSGGHYVTVWDVDKQGYALVDDQFGRDYDHESLRRLHLNVLWAGTQTAAADDLMQNKEHRALPTQQNMIFHWLRAPYLPRLIP